MTKEKIEEFAIQKWGELYNGSYPYLIGVEWEFFLKGIEVALNEYKYTKEDLKKSFEGGEYSNDEDNKKGQWSWENWIKVYELQQETGTTEISPKTE